MASFLEISNCHKNRFGKVSPCMCIESVILIIYPQSVLLCLMSDDFSENLFPPTKNLLTNIFLRILFKSIASQTNFTYTTTLSTSLIVTSLLFIFFPTEKKKKKALTVLHKSEICWHHNAIHLYLQIYHAIVNIA